MSPGADFTSLGINLNESDINSARGSPKHEKLTINTEENAPVRKRIVLLPTGIVESEMVFDGNLKDAKSRDDREDGAGDLDA